MNAPNDEPSGQINLDHSFDWQFACDRAEMLRQFKADFFATLNHDLRSPINNQISSLEIVLAELHESRAEMREFIANAQHSAKQHLELIEACLVVGRYCPPIQPLQLHIQPLLPILQRTYQLTYLQAQTQLITYPPVSGLGLDPQLSLWADERWLEQALLGLISWAISYIAEGSLALTVAVEPEAIALRWKITGDISELLEASKRAHQLNWSVPERLLRGMNGSVTLLEDTVNSAVVCCLLPRHAPE
ncbi:MAG: histidine kinase dimerization/phospho-acceptor domain-containing protein [Cyanobacteria bacterium P01_F01_bin.33]